MILNIGETRKAIMELMEHYMRDAVTVLDRIATELERLNRKLDDMTAKNDMQRSCLRVWNTGPVS